MVEHILYSLGIIAICMFVYFAIQTYEDNKK